MHARALTVARMPGAYFRTTLSSCSLRSNDVWKYAPTINCGGLELPVGFRSMTMFLVEQTTVPVASLPVSQFKHHLQLGTGFADDTAQDAVLEQYLRAAIAAIEARTRSFCPRRGPCGHFPSAVDSGGIAAGWLAQMFGAKGGAPVLGVS